MEKIKEIGISCKYEHLLLHVMFLPTISFMKILFGTKIEFALENLRKNCFRSIVLNNGKTCQLRYVIFTDKIVESFYYRYIQQKRLKKFHQQF